MCLVKNTELSDVYVTVCVMCAAVYQEDTESAEPSAAVTHPEPSTSAAGLTVLPVSSSQVYSPKPNSL